MDGTCSGNRHTRVRSNSDRRRQADRVDSVATGRDGAAAGRRNRNITGTVVRCVDSVRSFAGGRGRRSQGLDRNTGPDIYAGIAGPVVVGVDAVAGIRERCADLPVTTALTEVGSYGFFDNRT
jgi:hypothetical protein